MNNSSHDEPAGDAEASADRPGPGRAAPDGPAGGGVGYRPRHDHAVMGAAFGIRTGRTGPSRAAAGLPPTDEARPALDGIRIGGIAALAAGALLLAHAATGWLPWLSVVPALAAPGRTAGAGLVLVVVGVFLLARAILREPPPADGPR